MVSKDIAKIRLFLVQLLLPLLLGMVPFQVSMAASSISLTKSALPTSYSATGQTITYSYLVTNTGTDDITDVAITDNHSGLSSITCPPPTTVLTPNPPTNTATCTATYTITQTDLNNGTVSNSATASGLNTLSETITSNVSTVTINAQQNPSLNLVKSSTVTNFTAGETIPYNYQVTNTGNVTITNITVTDPHAGLSAINCPQNALDPGQIVNCTATYQATQADMDAGSISNTGQSNGLNPSGGTVTAPPSSLTINSVPAAPALSLVKSSTLSTYNAVGEVIPYNYLVTNTGNVTVSTIAVSDNKIPAPITCTPSTLAPGASVTCTGSYTVKLADMDAGSISNTATSTGKSPKNVTVTSNSSSMQLPATLNPALTVTKSSTTSSFSAPGTTISYQYTITNSGNDTINTIALSDDKIPAPLNCLASTLAPGVSTTCSGTYTTTQADVDNNGVTNIGTATGKNAQQTPVSGSSAPYTVPATQNPSIAMSKSTTTTSYSAAGQTASYSYAVTNTGNQTLYTVAINDPRITGPITCGSTVLAPNASTTCSATYTITQADVDAGSITNTATAGGQNQEGTKTVASTPSSVTIFAVNSPSLSLVKTSPSDPFDSIGVTLQYQYQVTNTGNTSLHSITIADNKIIGQITCPLTTLAPGEDTTCTGTYVTTQADIDRGGATNTAQAAGLSPDPNNRQFKSNTSTVTVPAIQNPLINMTKTTSTVNYANPNESIAYTYQVTNGGNDTLYNITINDNKVNANLVACASTTLAPGASTTCTATYETTQADVDAGGVTNTATASATNGVGTPVNSTPAQSVTVPALQSPGLSLVKSTTTPSFTLAGQTLSYTYLVKNTGNVTISFLTVQDDKTTVACGSTILAPHTSTNCTATYVTTQADVNNGSIVNVADAIGKAPDGSTVTSPPSPDATLTIRSIPTQGISVAKSATPTSFTTAGTQITYNYVVTNTGNLTLNPISLTDNRLGTITCPVTSLQPATSTTCQALYTTTAADVAAGSISNTASAAGVSSIGTARASSSFTVQGPKNPAISITKGTNVGGYGVGSTITYYYTVVNTGNVVLNPITVTDPHSGLSAISCPVTSLNPGAQTICSATYVTTQADVDAGSITDTASVVGQSPYGNASATSNSVTITAGGGGLESIAVTKSANVTSFSSTGTVITYTYVVTNTGQVGYNFTINDSPAEVITCDSTFLSGGKSATCTAQHSTTQADLDNGGISNTVTAAGPNFEAFASLSIPADQTPNLTLSKQAAAESYDAANETISYTYTLTNTGNITLTSVALSDNLVSATNLYCPETTLAPEQSMNCQGVYVTTQADVDNGTLTNIAMATAQQLPEPITASASIPGLQDPLVSLTKSTTATTYSAPGQVLHYSYLVKNLGNNTLFNVSVSDNKIPNPLTCIATSLVPGASTVCSGTYTTTLADVDAGKIDNLGTVTANNQLGTQVSSSSPVTVYAALSPSLSVVKTTTSPPFNAPGATINYSYVVTNTGNDTISNIGITDNKILGTISCTPTSIAPNATATCSGSYTTTQADVDAAGVTNNATAFGTNPQGSSVRSATASTTVPAIVSPSISLVKSNSPSTPNYNAPNIEIHYNYLVTNTGNDTLSNLKISDNKFSSSSQISCPATTLAPGASTTCTSIYVTTQADVDNGMIINTATATAQNPQGTVVPSSPSSVTVPAILTPSITMKKSTTVTSFNAAGVSIPYTYHVVNTGNDTLINIAIHDNKLTSGISCPVTTLSRGMATNCTGIYITTQADVDAGVLTNTAFASSQNNQGTEVDSPNSSVTLIPVQHPAITLTKTSTTATYAAVGDVVSYNYLVTNTGNDTLSSIVITDNKIPAANIHCPVTTLAPTVSTTCTGTYTVTLADIDAGSIVNTATTKGTNHQGTTVTSPNATATVNATLTPAISLVKSSTSTTFTAVGQSIPYQYLVKNIGNDTLKTITITDSKVSSANIHCPVTTLAPQATTTCTATYTVTLANMDQGFVTNTATAAAKNNQNTAVTSSPSQVTVTAIQAPAISMVKTALTTNYTAAGQTLNYRYRVTNTGNDTLSGIGISDDKVTTTITCTATSLAPGVSTNCFGSYVVSQADVDAGSVTNTAHASGTNTMGTTVTSTPSSATVPAIQTPKLSITKSGSPTSFSSVGTDITYTYVITNNGDVTITNLAVSDDVITSAISCNATTLAPNASTNCTGHYVTTLADLDAGEIINTAHASGKDPGGVTILSPNVIATVTAILNPAITMTKQTTATTYDTAGELIPYTYTIKNVGNDTLHNINVTDSKQPFEINCDSTSLAPGDSTICTGDYAVTQADIDAGTLTNVAIATGVNNQGTQVPSSPASVQLTATQNPAISLVKSAPDTFNEASQVIPYQFLVTNTGNDTLSNIAITDTKLTAPINCPQTSLAPGIAMTCTSTYTVTQADIEFGSISNTATVTGVNPFETAVESSSSVTINAVQMPAITMVKSTTTSGYTNPGDSIVYDYTVTNTGNDILNNIVIDDSQITGSIHCNSTSLEPNATTLCSATYVVTQADIDAGFVVNIATASGQNAAGTTVTSDESSVTVDAIPNPSLTLSKSSLTNNYHAAGNSIQYQYIVTNTGNDTLNNISISDDKTIVGLVCTQTQLAPGASTSCTGSYVVTQEDVDAGSVTNVATASGQGVFGTTVSPPSSVNVPAVLAPALNLTKVTTTPNYTNPGDTIIYTYVVTNTGNNTLMDITINDSLIPSGITCTLTTLAPQQFTTCSGSYAVTLADINHGSVTNTANAAGTDRQSVTTLSNEASATVPANIDSSVSLMKSADRPNYTEPGQVINYSYVVTNTGNNTLSNISISDTKINPVTCPEPSTIDPGTSLTCTGSYTVTQADVDAGSVLNSATASSTNPQSTVVQSATQSLVVPAIITDTISLTKTTTAVNFNQAGVAIPYQYDVVNTGNVTLYDLTINDDKIPTGITCQQTTLAPSASTTCNGTYTTTQADVDAGTLTNIATASARTATNIEATSPTSSTSIPAIQTPAISLEKSTDIKGYGFIDQEITYNYLIRNTGNETITNLAVVDNLISSGITCPPTSLAPNQTATCHGVYTVTQEDIDAATITNTASASGSTLGGTTIGSNESSLTLPYIPPSGTLTLVKTASISNFVFPGTPIVYSYLVTNNGVTNIHGITLNDSQLGAISCPVTTLAPKASTTCTASYVTTLADAQQGGINNVATVTGLTPTDIIVSATASLTVGLDADYVRKKTLAAIKNFLNDRAQLILSSEPDRRRIINRLTRQGGNCGNSPTGNIQPSPDSSGARFNAAMSFTDFCAEPSKYDVWAEIHASYFTQNTSAVLRHGEFGVAYLGVDYLVNSNILAGILTEFDAINRNGEGNNLLRASGQGAMVGPYLTARLQPDLYLHTRAAWGGSGNKINTFGFYDDSFTTFRSLYNAELVGDWIWRRLRISPTLGVSYFNEHQQAFNNFLNVSIPGQNVNLAQANFGPEFAYLMKLESAKELTLRLSVQGLYNFAYQDKGELFDNEFSSITAFSGRVKVGAELRFASGLSVTPMVLYDGIGNNRFNSIQAQLQLNYPID